MAGGNPTNWWNIMMNGSNMHPHDLSSSSQLFYGSSHVLADNNITQDHFPRSWSHLLLGGLSGEQEKSFHNYHEYKKLENWEFDQSLTSNNIQNIPFSSNFRVPVVDVKSESQGHVYGYHNIHQDQDLAAASSPANSCVTTALSAHNNTLNFSGNKKKMEAKHQHPDHSSESNSTSSGGVTKKARVQHSSAQPSLKVRKEKLGDRITALHQLVSPFGKTDTASVLSEAIGYIRFLHGQIEALSSPYMGHSQQQSYLGGNYCLGRISSASNQDFEHIVKDLRSRGLCLVPTACTQHVGNDTVGDYWAPSFGGGYL